MEIEIDSVSLEKRFLRYVQIDTQSAPIHSTYPSTEGQWTLLHLLKFELEALGLDEVVIDEFGYVMGKLAGRNCRADAPFVGFLAHVDTRCAWSWRKTSRCRELLWGRNCFGQWACTLAHRISRTSFVRRPTTYRDRRNYTSWSRR